MSVSAAFTPTGNTVTFTAATTAPTPVQIPTSGGLGSNQYRILNTSGNVLAFLGVGTSASAATSNAVVVSTTQSSIPLLPGTDEILTFPPNAYFTGITSSSTAVIYITPGDGL
jgi:hypothetical protein